MRAPYISRVRLLGPPEQRLLCQQRVGVHSPSQIADARLRLPHAAVGVVVLPRVRGLLVHVEPHDCARGVRVRVDHHVTPVRLPGELEIVHHHGGQPVHGLARHKGGRRLQVALHVQRVALCGQKLLEFGFLFGGVPLHVGHRGVSLHVGHRVGCRLTRSEIRARRPQRPTTRPALAKASGAERARVRRGVHLRQGAECVGSEQEREHAVHLLYMGAQHVARGDGPYSCTRTQIADYIAGRRFANYIAAPIAVRFEAPE